MAGGSSSIEEEQEPVSIRGLVLALILHLELSCLLLTPIKWRGDTHKEGAQTCGSPLPGVSLTGAPCQIFSIGVTFHEQTPVGNAGAQLTAQLFWRHRHLCASLCTAGQGEIRIWVTTLQDPKHEHSSAACLLTADIFSCHSTDLSGSEVPLECLQIQMEMHKTNLLDVLSSSAAYLKRIKFATMETLGLVSTLGRV